MSNQKTLFILLSIICISACRTIKKGISVPQPKEKMVNSNDGVYAPSENELLAAQTKNPSITMKDLETGFAIYKGECTNCHKTKSIYSRSETKWKSIIDEMAPKAKLNLEQKEAVYNYVLAIKATQMNK